MWNNLLEIGEFTNYNQILIEVASSREGGQGFGLFILYLRRVQDGSEKYLLMSHRTWSLGNI